MTREDIIRMAREAGAEAFPHASVFSANDIERFFHAAYAAGAAAEREECAKVCEEYDDDRGTGETWGPRFAAMIRARSKE